MSSIIFIYFFESSKITKFLKVEWVESSIFFIKYFRVEQSSCCWSALLSSAAFFTLKRCWLSAQLTISQSALLSARLLLFVSPNPFAYKQTHWWVRLHMHYHCSRSLYCKLTARPLFPFLMHKSSKQHHLYQLHKNDDDASEDFLERERDGFFIFYCGAFDGLVYIIWMDGRFQAPPCSGTYLALLHYRHTCLYVCFPLYCPPLLLTLVPKLQNGDDDEERALCAHNQQRWTSNHGGGGTTNPVLHSRLTFLQSSLLQL